MPDNDLEVHSLVFDPGRVTVWTRLVGRVRRSHDAFAIAGLADHRQLSRYLDGLERVVVVHSIPTPRSASRPLGERT
ncbi:MAG: hypothetical protein LC808_19975 [Actinobacteria bacterium]|nr:hypothetical protein [Actinomycetota bacterium]